MSASRNFREISLSSCSQLSEPTLHNGSFVSKRTFESQTAEDFLREYVHLVLNAGMKNQIAEKIFQNHRARDINAIRHLSKRRTIEKAERNYRVWWNQLSQMKTLKEQLYFLEHLPWIGKITKYHSARNLGIDAAKPDRHFIRLAEKFGYDSVQDMCRDISARTGDRVGIVNVVLWRFCNVFPKYKEW